MNSFPSRVDWTNGFATRFPGATATVACVAPGASAAPPATRVLHAQR